MCNSTLIHEATHLRDVLGTSDHGYGVELCKQFALEDPKKAVDNAELVFLRPASAPIMLMLSSNHDRFAVEVGPFGP